MTPELLLVLAPWALAWLVTPRAASWALRRGWVDHPGERKAHTAPVPYLGGPVLFGAAAAGTLACAPWLPVLQSAAGPLARIALLLLGVVGLGLIDDRLELTPRVKLAGQLGIAVVTWLLGFQIGKVELPGSWAIAGGPAVSLVLTVLWIVALTNAFNLIDGMDGLAAGLALITATTLLLLAADQSAPVRVGALALCGALAGFLRYNLPPARIFLGDAGAMGLGYTVAVFSILSFQKSSTAMVVAVPLLVVGIPILDILLAVTRRLRAHVQEPSARGLRLRTLGSVLFRADRRHIHHVLLRAGLGPDRVLLCLYAAAAALASVAVVMREAGSTVRWVVVLGVLGSGVLLWPALERRVLARESVRVGEAATRGETGEGSQGSLDSLTSTRRHVG